MLLGQTLCGIDDTTVAFYSPWFPRGGNLAKFTCQVFASADISGGGEAFKITVETKNVDDSDKDVVTPQGGGLQTITLASPPVLTTWEVGANLSSGNTGFLELVRFKYWLISETSDVEPWVHFRMLNPIWLTN